MVYCLPILTIASRMDSWQSRWQVTTCGSLRRGKYCANILGLKIITEHENAA